MLKKGCKTIGRPLGSRKYWLDRMILMIIKVSGEMAVVPGEICKDGGNARRCV
jgi:hypothetical protein